MKKIKISARLLEQWDKEYIWHPFTQMNDWERETPLIIDKAQGNYLFDIHGQKYLDGISSLWVTVHGHRRKEIDAAIKHQVDKVSHSTLLGLSNTPAIVLAKSLIEIAPKGLKKVFYSDNGSTAVEIALKMSYQYWQQRGQSEKNKFVSFSNAYHGDTIGSVSLGGIDLFHQVYKPLLFHTIQANLANACELIATHHKELAACVIEPLMQGAAGMLLQPKGFLKQLKKVCADYGVLLIFDEVATGFGRTGKMFACNHENVSPDILCAAKGITGGYLPLAVTLTTQKVYEGFKGEYKDLKTFFHGHTYTGNPLASAAAIANIEIFKKEKTLEKMQPKIKYLKKKLQSLKKLKHVGEIRQLGFMIGIELMQDAEKKIAYPWVDRIGVQVIMEARKRGLILRPLGNVIVLMPPLSITIKEIDYLVDTTGEAIKKITQA